MNPVTQPVGVQPPRQGDEGFIKDWLDGLAGGSCTSTAFLHTMRERFHANPDGNWEVLSQLDQYYRRGKIKADIFLSVKSALAASPLGSPQSALVLESAPVPAAKTDVPAARDAVSIPVVAPVEPEIGPARPEPAPGMVDRELVAGSVLRDRYRIECVLGRGGMGTVFQAVDEFRLEGAPGGQRLAIKVLHTEVTVREALLAELRHEFQNLQLLSHPNIVRVFDFDRDGSMAFFTMELLSGVLLSRVLESRKPKPLERSQALAAIRDVGAAIAHAHSRGVVHGDVNPQNIFVTDSGEIRVLDFGASQRLAPSTPDRELAMPFATPDFASCQVLQGERPDVRDDMFSLGCMAYVLLSGQHPFSQSTALEARAVGLKPRRPHDLTHQQWRTLRAALRLEREDRPGDVQQWLEQLQLNGAASRMSPVDDLLEPPATGKPMRWAAVFIAALVLLGGGYWLAHKSRLLPESAGAAPTLAPSEAIQTPPPETTPTGEAIRTPAPEATRTPTPETTQTPAIEAARSPAPETTHKSAPAASALAQAERSSVPVPQVISPAAVPSPVVPTYSRVEMAADTIDVPSSDSLARIVVRRKGNMRGDISFMWWTESGTAKPGTDFESMVPQREQIPDGKSSISLSIPVVAMSRAQPRSFYVVIDQPEGATLGTRALTMITLLNSQ